jgi:hypothetical protein
MLLASAAASAQASLLDATAVEVPAGPRRYIAFYCARDEYREQVHRCTDEYGMLPACAIDVAIEYADTGAPASIPISVIDARFEGTPLRV